MAENHFASWPTALYGIVLLMAAISYIFLQKQIIRTEGEKSELKITIGHDYKGKITIILYSIGICIALISPHFSQVFYVIVALIWLIPDRRIERILN